MLKYFTKFYEGGAALTGGNMVAQNMCLGEKKITKLMSFFYVYISIRSPVLSSRQWSVLPCCAQVRLTDQSELSIVITVTNHRRGGRVECPALCAPDEEVLG